MSKKKKTAALSASALSAAVVGGTMFAPTAVAETEESAFGISASGLINIAPTPLAEGEESETVVGSDVLGLAEATVLNAETSPNYAYADVANLSVLPEEVSGVPSLPGLSGNPLVAVTGTVSATCDNGELDSDITTLTIAGNEVPIGNLEPNTKLLPEQLEGIAQVTLNKQTEDTVTAVHIQVLENAPGLSEIAGQSISIASATCTAGDDSDDDNGDDDNGNGDDDNGNGDDDNGSGGDNGDGGDGGNGGSGTGGDDQAGSDGSAPTPDPKPGHLAVTG